MDDYDSQNRKVALTCGRGHPWGPAPLSVSCVRDHLVVHCSQPGCTETWQTDVDTLVSVLGNRAPEAAADRGSLAVMAALEAVWALVRRAREYQRDLLRASHPSAARLARLGSWIQECVTATNMILESETLAARSDEFADVAEIAAKVSVVVDTFHIYVGLLEKSRRASLGAFGVARAAPLAAVADDERVLLGCRADLRDSIGQLTAEL